MAVWRAGRLEARKGRRLESWKVGRLEGWKAGRLKCWKVGRLEAVSRHFPYLKVSRNSKTTKSLQIMTFQGILLFLLFLDTFCIQKILSFLLFPDTFGKGWKVRMLVGWKVRRLGGWKVRR